MTSMKKLVPNDPRLESRTASLNGRVYHYLVLPPDGPPHPENRNARGTVILLHGFPDIHLGWRYQAPALAAIGLRVVIPDMLGYGGTDAPDDPAEYARGKIADDVAALASHLCEQDRDKGGEEDDDDDNDDNDDNDGGGTNHHLRRHHHHHHPTPPRVILGGCDWGGVVAWDTARRYPAIVRAVFAGAAPYIPPAASWVSLEDRIAAGQALSFRYQLQFGREEMQAHLDGSPDRIRQFLNVMFRSEGKEEPDDDDVFDPCRGLRLEGLADATPSPLLTADEMDFYVAQLARRSMRGPLNWYRNRRATFDADRAEAEAGLGAGAGAGAGEQRVTIAAPALLILGRRDPVVLPETCAGMAQYIDRLTVREVDASHWVMVGPWAEEVAAIVTGWLEGVLAEE